MISERVQCDVNTASIPRCLEWSEELARTIVSPDEMEQIAKELRSFSERVSALANAVREVDGLPGVPLHLQTFRNTYIRRVEDWIEETEIDTGAVLRAHKKGVKSRIEIAQDQARKRKEKSESKKPKGKKGDVK